MTAIPGHNLILQQSGIVQELHHQAATPKPSPDQAAVLQQAQQVVQNTRVQLSEQTERPRKKKESRPDPRRNKKRKTFLEDELIQDSDATGRILDTIV